MKRFWVPGMVTLLAGLLLSCGKRQEEVRVYAVTGVVEELQPAKSTAVIRHQEIPGYMVAMTMPFRVRDTNELSQVAEGDTVEFELHVTADAGWIEKIEKQEMALPPPPTTGAFRLVRDVEPLEVGDPLPDYTFTNDLGNEFSLADFRGQALGLTFIFTRCPYPDFCPRMSAQFAAVHKLLSNSAGPTNWHLLSLSFDPAFDTPKVLRSYAKTYRKESSHWTFATGAMIEIDALTEQFGLYYFRENPVETWNHVLRSVVVDPEGKVQHIFVGNSWTPEEFAAEMEKAMSQADEQAE